MKDNFWVEESSVQSVCKKRKKRVGKRILEFVGWGSRPLIEFLEAIGRDTREKHSQQDVASFISKYINEKGLASAEKKKKVLCDERLYELFGKKSMSRIKVYEMLEEHFAENHNDSDDEFSDSTNEDYGEKKPMEFKNIRTGQTKVFKTPKSCFAAIVPENIKLIYLKRSVIQDLLKFPESFECKVVGSFVRIKSDPNDIYQKNRFLLQQVTGVQKISDNGDADDEIYLRLSNFYKDVAIPMLSDDNFTEEEVEDVLGRIKAGLLNRLTVNELQLKAQLLHVDITNNWIAKEISLLQKRAEHASEKGWLREKFDYLERRKLLQKPSEQEKILLKVPEVVAEELEIESTVAASCEKTEISASSPKSILRESSDVSSADASGSGEIDTPPKVISSDSQTLKVQNVGVDDVISIPLKDPKANTVKQGMVVANVSCGESSRDMQGVGSGEKRPHEGEVTWVIASPNVTLDGNSTLPQQDPSTAAIIELSEKHPREGEVTWVIASPNVTLDGNSTLPQQDPSTTAVIELSEKHPRGEPEQPIIATEVIAGSNVIHDGNSTRPQQPPPPPPSTATVIELSDDDDDDDDMRIIGEKCGENPNDAVWHYMDPLGQTQGPFTLCLLKRWSDGKYFDASFRVWKTGKTSDDGLLLADVLRRTFPF